MLRASGRVQAALLLAGLLYGSPFEQTVVDSGEDARIAVNVNLVVQHATVRDRNGALVPHLAESNFTVFENGTRQKISYFRRGDVAVSSGLVIDHSGSMRELLPDVMKGARAFAEASNEADEMFVINFNDTATLALPLARRGKEGAHAVQAAIGDEATTGQTALYDAIALGLNQLKTADSEKKVLLVVSDGGDNASRTTLPELLDLVHESNVLIYTIGIFDITNRDQNPGVLKKISRASGGDTFLPKTSMQAMKHCQEIAEMIRQQYTIAYSPSPAPVDGSTRTVRIEAQSDTAEKLKVQNRRKYVAGETSPHPRKK